MNLTALAARYGKHISRFSSIIACCCLGLCLSAQATSANEAVFQGKYFSGKGDLEYFRLLDISRRMFAPDPQYQNISMLYITNWNGLVEGPTWDAWWIQNSYGPTYAVLPFLQEPFVTFLQNSHDLWFDQMGDGKRAGTPNPPFNWVAPDGCLCDAARPGWVVYKQGDCRTDLHDWAVEFTAAGILMQSELLLIGHDRNAVEKYLPKLERSANFIESRRDTNDLFLAGPAGNLLAPSYAGWKKPDGSYGMAYLTGLSITYIAALDRLIELEKLAGRTAQVNQFTERREKARKALPRLTTEEGYFIRSLDPDGVRHGVYGAAKHGYFETSPNHDAVAFRVANDAQAERIMQKIVSIPQLRPYDFILPNYPCYDDIYDKPEGLWAFGTWVNGGHWSTCEARMILAYYRTGRYQDAAKSMRQLLTFADRFRMDNPLTKFGADVYQPAHPINLCYDSFGPPAAMVRGLFEYIYAADSLTLLPHIPPTIDQIEQQFPVRFGNNKIYLSAAGNGPITEVRVNGRSWKQHDAVSVTLPYDKLQGDTRVRIVMGEGKFERVAEKQSQAAKQDLAGVPADLQEKARKLRGFLELMSKERLSQTYLAAHAQLTLEAILTIGERQQLSKDGKINPLPPASQKAADQSYIDTAEKLYAGLVQAIQVRENGSKPEERQIGQLWARVSARN